MNNETKLSGTTINGRHQNRRVRAVALVISLFTVAGALIYSAFADAPALTIADFGGNQFSITVTNGGTSNNYTLYWTPAVNDANYPWVVLTNSAVGEWNFLVDCSQWPSGFFKVLLGTDADGDGVPEWWDAQPQNPNVGLLSVTIDSPVNGTVFR